jgi:L-ascorbate metabolism protein UlaG (beta-lactamase superfamily)
MYLTWLNSNSWLIEMADQRILLDPWLVGSLVFGNAKWLVQGDHCPPQPIPNPIDLILLSQGLEDHAHPETLQALNRDIPVVASPNAANVVKNLGYDNITALTHGECVIWKDQVKIQAVPGSVVGYQQVENGYILQDLKTGHRLYYEPHGSHSPQLKTEAPVDVIITPLIDLKLPVIGTVIQGSKAGLEVAEWLKPQVMVSTAAGGDVTFKGILMTILKEAGSIAEFRERLMQRQPGIQVLEPKPGDRIAVPLKSISQPTGVP